MSENMTPDMETEEYVTFFVKSKEGKDIEMAVVDEFEFEKKNYLVSAVVENDTVNEEDVFIYRMKLTGEDGFTAEQITDEREYEKVVNAYLELE